MVDDLTVCFRAVGRFPEVGDEIENIDFLHGLSFSSWDLTGRIFEGFHGAESLKQKA